MTGSVRLWSGRDAYFDRPTTGSSRRLDASLSDGGCGPFFGAAYKGGLREVFAGLHPLFIPCRKKI